MKLITQRGVWIYGMSSGLSNQRRRRIVDQELWFSIAGKVEEVISTHGPHIAAGRAKRWMDLVR